MALRPGPELSERATPANAREGQLVQLICDIVPSSGGAVLPGRDADDLRSAAGELPGPVDLAERAA